MVSTRAACSCLRVSRRLTVAGTHMDLHPAMCQLRRNQVGGPTVESVSPNAHTTIHGNCVRRHGPWVSNPSTWPIHPVAPIRRVADVRKDRTAPRRPSRSYHAQPLMHTCTVGYMCASGALSMHVLSSLFGIRYNTHCPPPMPLHSSLIRSLAGEARVTHTHRLHEAQLQQCDFLRRALCAEDASTFTAVVSSSRHRECRPT